MSIELLAVGVKCNLGCTYCYEDPMRWAGNHASGYDIAAMKRGLEAEGGRFSFFGGEPLLMPFDDFDEMARWGREKWGGTAVQTNGALITDRWLDLFARHNVGVGISVDGPGALNDARWAGSLEKTRAATDATMASIDALIAAGRTPSLIVTLHRKNAAGPRLLELLDWVRSLDAKGVEHMRLHLLEIEHDDVRRDLALTEDENVLALVRCLQLEPELSRLRFDLFEDMKRLLLGAGDTSCVWNACDPLTTPAVHGVSGDGARTNCSRTNKDGVDWVKADAHGTERYQVLHETPWDDGGCKDCRFFFACKGQCPGTAIDGDWRNRSEECRVWYRLFERIETALVGAGHRPVSLDKVRRAAAEEQALTGHPTQEHGDHYDVPDGQYHADGGYVWHGDAGRTDYHADVPHVDHGDAAPEMNGFATRSAMDMAHAMILNTLAGSPPRGTVLDLGCGDGTLHRLVGARFHVDACGLEVDRTKAAPASGVMVGDLRRVGELVQAPVDTIMVSKRRFEEIPTLHAWVATHCRQAVVYSYDAPMWAEVQRCDQAHA